MPSLVVSLHDVSPITYLICDQMLKELKELGVTKTSLLVIPNHHRRVLLEQAPEFQSWLREQVENGHEPVLHGYFHQRSSTKKEGPIKKFTTEIYTAGEGEFFDLRFKEAQIRLEQGLDALHFLNRPIRGFIAPAWLLSLEAQQAVIAAGFAYTTLVGYLKAFTPAHVWPSRSLVWSTRKAWRTRASLVWNSVLYPVTKTNKLLRISLHPPDYNTPSVWHQIQSLIRLAVAQRIVATYESFVLEQGSTL